MKLSRLRKLYFLEKKRETVLGSAIRASVTVRCSDIPAFIVTYL